MGHLLPYCHPGYIFITFTHLVPTRLLHIYCTRSSKKISSRPAQYNCFLIQLPLLFFQGFLVLHKRRIRNRKKKGWNYRDHLEPLSTWTLSTVDLRIVMTSSGLGAQKIAVPATMTLLPMSEISISLGMLREMPAWRFRITCMGAYFNVFWTYTTINLDIHFRKTVPQFSNFGNTAFHKFLSSVSCGGAVVSMAYGLVKGNGDMYRDRLS